MESEGNLFEAIPVGARQEVIDTLASTASVRVERIVSNGQATPAGQWYDQQDEFVLLVSGAAAVAFQGETGEHALTPGQWLWIPARRRHRVTWTSEVPPAVWLAVFAAADASS